MENHALSSYPLFIQFHQLLGDFGCVEGQSEAGQIQLREKELQHLFDGQPSGGAVLRGGRHCILQDRTSKSCQLNERRLQRGAWERKECIPGILGVPWTFSRRWNILIVKSCQTRRQEKKMQVSAGFKVIPSSYCTLKEVDIKQQDNYDSRPWVKRKWNWGRRGGRACPSILCTQSLHCAGFWEWTQSLGYHKQLERTKTFSPASLRLCRACVYNGLVFPIFGR